MTLPVAAPVPRGTVLIVDDEDQIRRLFKRALERAGHDILLAPDARTALAILAAQPVDVVLSDINMPDMDGTEMVQELRKSGVRTPAILVTGRPTVESAARAVEFGATRYLKKPVGREELCEAVTDAVAVNAELKHQRALADSEERSRQEREQLDSDLTTAIDKLWMAYQPIITTKDARLAACEALVRSDHEAMPHPGAIFPAAERLNRIGELGREIRRRAPEPLQARADVLLFVNLHPSDLADDTL